MGRVFVAGSINMKAGTHNPWRRLLQKVSATMPKR
jgi:hypothetical protein